MKRLADDLGVPVDDLVDVLFVAVPAFVIVLVGLIVWFGFLA